MPYTAEEKCWIWLQKALEQRNAAQLRLVHHFGSAQEVWRAVRDQPQEIEALPRISPRMLAGLRSHADPVRANAFFHRMEQLGVFAVTLDSPDYPPLLRQISAPPLVLYAKGRRELLATSRAIAVIGRRTPEQYGRDAADMIAKGLAGGKVAVVSGMAYGIDSCAHAAALDAGGDSIAVLGCGPDVIYPREKEAIYHELCRRGAVISEYPPGTEPLREHFPARNRIISGLCSGVVIVEAAVRSGTKITVDFALEQGRDVFAVPGNIFSQGSEGTNELLQEGAIPVRSAGDILSHYGWRPGEVPRVTLELTPQERLIADTLAQDEIEFDELYEQLDMTMPQLSSTLSEMELKGIIVCLPGRRYAIKHH